MHSYAPARLYRKSSRSPYYIITIRSTASGPRRKVREGRAFFLARFANVFFCGRRRRHPPPRRGRPEAYPPRPRTGLGNPCDRQRFESTQVDCMTKSQRAEGRGTPSQPNGGATGNPTTSGVRARRGIFLPLRVTWAVLIKLGRPTANPRGGRPKARAI